MSKTTNIIFLLIAVITSTTILIGGLQSFTQTTQGTQINNQYPQSNEYIIDNYAHINNEIDTEGICGNTSQPSRQERGIYFTAINDTFITKITKTSLTTNDEASTEPNKVHILDVDTGLYLYNGSFNNNNEAKINPPLFISPLKNYAVVISTDEQNQWDSFYTSTATPPYFLETIQYGNGAEHDMCLDVNEQTNLFSSGDNPPNAENIVIITTSDGGSSVPPIATTLILLAFGIGGIAIIIYMIKHSGVQ